MVEEVRMEGWCGDHPNKHGAVRVGGLGGSGAGEGPKVGEPTRVEGPGGWTAPNFTFFPSCPIFFRSLWGLLVELWSRQKAMAVRTQNDPRNAQKQFEGSMSWNSENKCSSLVLVRLRGARISVSKHSDQMSMERHSISHEMNNSK